jgi:hypothetical protein
MSDTNADPWLQWEDRVRDAARSGVLEAEPSDAIAAALHERAETGNLSPDVEAQSFAAVQAALLDRRLSRAAAQLGPVERAASLGQFIAAAADAARVSWAEWAERLGISVRALESLVRSDVAALRLPPRAMAGILDALDLPLARAGRILSSAIADLGDSMTTGELRSAASIPTADLTRSLSTLMDSTAECLRDRDREDLAGMQ